MFVFAYLQKMVRKIPLDAATQRKNALKRDGRYGENAAGKWVRSSAFREIDYDPSDPTHLREFDTFEEAFAFDEECRLNGTGGRKAAHLLKPKHTVPKEQLALEEAVRHTLRGRSRKKQRTGIATNNKSIKREGAFIVKEEQEEEPQSEPHSETPPRPQVETYKAEPIVKQEPGL